MKHCSRIIQRSQDIKSHYFRGENCNENGAGSGMSLLGASKNGPRQKNNKYMYTFILKISRRLSTNYPNNHYGDAQ